MEHDIFAFLLWILLWARSTLKREIYRVHDNLRNFIELVFGIFPWFCEYKFSVFFLVFFVFFSFSHLSRRSGEMTSPGCSECSWMDVVGNTVIRTRWSTVGIAGEPKCEVGTEKNPSTVGLPRTFIYSCCQQGALYQKRGRRMKKKNICVFWCTEDEKTGKFKFGAVTIPWNILSNLEPERFTQRLQTFNAKISTKNGALQRAASSFSARRQAMEAFIGKTPVPQSLTRRDLANKRVSFPVKNCGELNKLNEKQYI